MMTCFRETTFWAKTSLSFVFRGPNSVHADIFRCANHNGTSFKAVWWSVSEKLHFGLKHHFPLYLEGQTQCILKFSGVSIIMVQEVKAVWWSVSEKPHFELKDHFPLYLEGQTHAPWSFQVCQSQWYKFQSCMMICFRETTFWAKTSLSFVFRGPNSVHADIFRVCQSQWYKFQSCMMICFWEKPHFG